MTIFNDTFLPIMQKQIGQLRQDGKQDFSTVDLIKQYIGHFISDNTNAHDSINANIGKFLSDNSDSLGIVFLREETYTDTEKKPTQTAVWKFK